MTMDSLQASRIAGGNSAIGRRESDFYPTPPEVTVALLDEVLGGKELEQDEVNRAATMREKTLRIIESRPEQIHAHLVIDWLGDTRCSNCGEDVNCTEPFCQHCGARLDEPEVKEY